jgi:hypothetical protein
MLSTEERFGRLRLLSYEWEPEKPNSIDLADWRASLSLDAIEVLYVIGVGDGSPYEPLRTWLVGDPKRRLVFLEKEGSLLASLFEQEHPLLADPQVDLEWLNGNEALQAVAERHPAEKIEVVALPGIDPKKIRLQLLRKTTLSYSIYLDRLYGYQHFHNFVRNVPRLKGAFYANSLRNAFPGTTAIICGAGPSLEQAIPLLKELEGRALILAGGSAIAALSGKGIDPHFGLAVDPNLEEVHRFKNSFAFEMPLLTSTRLHPDVYNTCNGPFGHLRSGVGGAPEIWLEEELGLTDPLLGQNLDDESISVTSIALAFAQMIGCTTILLAGMDLAYTNGQRYAPGISSETIRFREIESQKRAMDRILRRKDKNGRPVQTAVRWVMEAFALSHYAKSHPEIRWINTTDGGLPIPRFQQLPLSEAISTFCTEQTDLRGLIARSIALNPMPDPTAKLEELKSSLIRIVAHLEILAGEKPGSKALAELELFEELAASLLFYDIQRIIDREQPVDRWAFFLSLARKYASCF